MKNRDEVELRLGELRLYLCGKLSSTEIAREEKMRREKLIIKSIFHHIEALRRIETSTSSRMNRIKKGALNNTQIGSDGSSHEYQFVGYWLTNLVGKKISTKSDISQQKQKNTRRK